MNYPTHNRLPINFVNDIKAIITSGQQAAYSTAGKIAIMTYWKIGRRIVEEEQGGNARAEYGKGLTKELAKVLTIEYGHTYSQRNLEYYRKFFQLFKNIEILNTRVQNLEWSHFRRLLSVESEKARMWYLNEASKGMWSVRTLDRNVSTKFYERRLAAMRDGEELPETIVDERSPLNYIKSPVVAASSIPTIVMNSLS